MQVDFQVPMDYDFPSCEMKGKDFTTVAVDIPMLDFANFQGSHQIVIYLNGGPAHSMSEVMTNTLEKLEHPGFIVYAVNLRGTQISIGEKDAERGYVEWDNSSRFAFGLHLDRPSRLERVRLDLKTITTNHAACDVIHIMRQIKSYFLNDLEALLSKLNVPNFITENFANTFADVVQGGFVLYGHSYGSYLAQRVMAFDDSLIRKLIIEGVVSPDAAISSPIFNDIAGLIGRVARKCLENSRCRNSFGASRLINFADKWRTFRHDNECAKKLGTPEDAKAKILGWLNLIAQLHYDSLEDGKYEASLEETSRFLVVYLYCDPHEKSALLDIASLPVATKEKVVPGIVYESGKLPSVNVGVYSLIIKDSNVLQGNRKSKEHLWTYKGEKQIILFQGEMDFATPLEQAQRAKAFYKNSQLIVVPKIGHTFLWNPETPCGQETFSSILNDDSIPTCLLSIQ